MKNNLKKSHYVQIYPVPIHLMFKLRTKPTQFTKGKTEDTLCDLAQRYILNSEETEYHLLDIIVTNKSLPETEQWKIRTDKKLKKFNNITIDILSSKSTDYNDISKYIHNIFNCKTKDELPNILIICYHTKRVCDDLINLFNIFAGVNYIQPVNKIKFHISFDEPDANLGVTKKFIKKIKSFIQTKLIIGILFITATPVKEFWKMLNESGIKTLLNMNHNNTQNFDEELENYRSFKEHNIILYDNSTLNPLDYIISAFSTEVEIKDEMGMVISRKPIIDESERKIIFAPAHLYTTTEGVGSHMEVTNYFMGRGYCVFLMNGSYKGFIYPNNQKITLDDFNRENNIEDELRISLAKWNELNPTLNLVITGYWVIERGITFNTIGFNFTDMILSNYHLKCLNKLIQIAGRSTGGKTFVRLMNIICTSDVRNAVIEFNDNLEKICSLNPEHFNKTDFISSKNTIPIKVVFHDNDLLNLVLQIRETSKRGYKQQLHNILVQGFACGKITFIDKNNAKKFILTERTINQVRMYKLGDIIEVRRFKNFDEAFENYKTVSQSCEEMEYNIDLAKDIYILDDFENPPNIAWITYKV